MMGQIKLLLRDQVQQIQDRGCSSPNSLLILCGVDPNTFALVECKVDSVARHSGQHPGLEAEMDWFIANGLFEATLPKYLIMASSCASASSGTKSSANLPCMCLIRACVFLYLSPSTYVQCPMWKQYLIIRNLSLDMACLIILSSVSSELDQYSFKSMTLL